MYDYFWLIFGISVLIFGDLGLDFWWFALEKP